MYTLAIDTALDYLRIGLMRDKELLLNYTSYSRFKQGKNMFPTLDFVLQQQGVSLQEIDLFAVTTGPGSFTGIRIGMAIAKTLAQIYDKQMVGVNTLEALAYMYQNHTEIICSTLIHLRNEIYAAFFSIDQFPNPLTPIKLYTQEQLIEDIFATRYESILIIGDASRHLQPEHFPPASGRLIAIDKKVRMYDGATIAQLAYERYIAEEATDYYSVNPLYVKEYYNPYKRIFVTGSKD